MKMQISFAGKVAKANFSREEFLAEVEGELQKFNSEAKGASLDFKATDAPDGAQGAEELLVWAVELASSAEMAGVYLRGLVAALNEICRSKAQPAQIPENDEVSDEDETGQKELDLESKRYLLALRSGGRAITLPATAAALKKFLDESGLLG